MSRFVLLLAISCSACGASTTSDVHDAGAGGTPGAGGSAGGGAVSSGGSGSGGLNLGGDTGDAGECPVPFDPSVTHLPDDCTLLSDQDWAANDTGCGKTPPVAVDATCTAADPGPILTFSGSDPCAEADALPSKHAERHWDYPIAIQADCAHATLSHAGETLEITFGGSFRVANWIAAGEPTALVAEADVAPNGCSKRVRITKNCTFADAVIAELPASGGDVAFGGVEFAKLWPDSVGPACAGGPPALCGHFTWVEHPANKLGCEFERTLPTCGTMVQQCVCGGGELDVVAGRAACEGPVRLAWFMLRTPYWRCL